VVAGKKGLPQYLMKLGLGRITCIDARRATNHAVAQDRRADLADTEAIVACVAAQLGSCLSIGIAAAAQARDEHGRCACDSGQHDRSPVLSEGIHWYGPFFVGCSVASSGSREVWHDPLEGRRQSTAPSPQANMTQDH